MTHDLAMLAWTLVLGLVQLVVAALGKRMQEPSGWAAGARDTPLPAYEGMAGRLDRAHRNLMETLPLFVGAVLLSHVAGRGGELTSWGTSLYFWGRLVYVPLYAAGVPYVRTVVWMAAFVGICLVVSACLVPG